MDERETRIGRNEALFRHVNERLREIGTSFSLVSEASEFVCECGDPSCVEPIRMSLEDYERIRSNPSWFAMRPGHEIPEVEWVVERHEGWDLIEKRLGAPAALAEDTDPRG